MAAARHLPLLTLVLLLLAACSPAHASTFFVDQKGGREQNPGTEARPFADLAQCAQIMVAGDTCLVKDGEYRGGLNISGGEGPWKTRSGAPGAPIAFRAHPGHRPRLIVSGFQAIGITPDRGVTEFFELEGFRIEGTVALFGSGPSAPARGVVVRNNEIRAGSFSSDNNWSGIFLKDLKGARIENNFIHDVVNPSGRKDGTGLRIFRCMDCVVRNNRIENNEATAIDNKDAGRNTVYERNLLIQRTGATVFRQGNNLGAFKVDERVRENIFMCPGGGPPFIWVVSENQGLWVHNNTVIGCDGPRFGSVDNRPQRDVRFYNNILSGGGVALSQELQNGLPDLLDFNVYAGPSQFFLRRFSPQQEVFDSFESWRDATQYDDHSLQDMGAPAAADRNARSVSALPGRAAGCDPDGCSRADRSTSIGALPRNDGTVIGLLPGSPGDTGGR